ncbi:hypothetical protein [Myroides sp. C15-4]|uniref:hypothetical protein n=1 Tax=Myroides sp. C15-4 TaxID=3400532 RepID=UPI003D2F90E3
MDDGKWEMGDGKWEMGNGRWEMGDGKWEMGNGRWEMGDGKWVMVQRTNRREQKRNECIKLIPFFVVYCEPVRHSSPFSHLPSPYLFLLTVIELNIT